MDTQEALESIKKYRPKDVFFNFSTGTGKTKAALDVLEMYNKNTPLIVIPKLTLINTWKDEIIKWNKSINPLFITYLSFINSQKWARLKFDSIIYDECHHITDKCMTSASKNIHLLKEVPNILLSATVKRDRYFEIKKLFPNLYKYTITLRKAIDIGRLPDPRVLLIKLSLDDKQKSIYNDMELTIQYLKRRAFNNTYMKKVWFRKCLDRQQWLSNQKTDIVKKILFIYRNYRTITFCNSIKHSEELGKYCITSKHKDSQEYLDKFNNKKIKHITCVNCLDEGVNLADCKIGIYAVLSASDRLIKQRLGRSLRHKNPLIIIPYYEGTRDEEIVKQMVLDYNQELIIVRTEQIIDKYYGTKK